MSPDPDLRRYPVLYVDDERNNLLVFSAVFGDEFQVYTAATPEAALEILDREPVAVALFDQRMPGMTGTALAERVRAHHPRVERIIVTAYWDAAEAVEAINRGGVSHWIGKPWEAEAVAAVLRAAVQRRAREDLGRELRARVLQAERLALLALVTRDLPAAPPRPEAGPARPPPPERLSLPDVLDAILPLCRAEIERRAVLRLELGEAPEVLGDPAALGQVLLHLLVNAGQAIAPGRRAEHQVKVVLGRDGDDARLEIHDTGEGIAAERLETIFEPFFTTRGAAGTGLGLAIVRQSLEAQGGTVTVRSTPGAGSVFLVRLPGAPATQA